MFDHQSLQKSRGELPSFGIILESLKNRDTERAKQLIAEIFPGGWVDSKDFRGNTLLHTVCSCRESFDGKFNEWMIQQNPNNQFCIQHEDGETPLHLICRLITRVPYSRWDPDVVVDLSPEREAALTVKSILERFPDSAKIVEGRSSGDTLFRYLLSSLYQMFRTANTYSMVYIRNHFQDHIRIIIDVAEFMLRLAPQVASIQYEFQDYPLDMLEAPCRHWPIQDFIESIFRATYPSILYSLLNPFYVLLHETLQKEASMSKIICDMKEVQLLLSKANKTTNPKLSDEAVECYRLWSDDRIRKLSESIKDP